MITDWKKSIIDLGSVKEGEQVDLVFEYEGYQPIEEANSSCGCSTPRIDGNKIHVSFKAPNMPTHLEVQGKKSYLTTKSILVALSGQDRPDHLKFKATIHKK